MKKKGRVVRLLGLLAAVCLMFVFAGCSGESGVAGDIAMGVKNTGSTITYTGQGFTFDGTTWVLNDQRCGEAGEGTANDGGTGQFADWNGAGQPYQVGQAYLVWVLTANGATSATITLPNGTFNMIPVGGAFKYASPYFTRDTLVNLPVTATYQGNARNAQLVVSHGCPGFKGGAWCSPGFWRNASDDAWTLTGIAKTDLFNNTVVPNYYDTASAADPTLITVLTTPGANTFGGPSNPFGLNAYNATGAFLTANIPGFSFDASKVGDEEACPIDNHGNFKQQQ
jgi:hypothetical protein